MGLLSHQESRKRKVSCNKVKDWLCNASDCYFVFGKLCIDSLELEPVGLCFCGVVVAFLDNSFTRDTGRLVDSDFKDWWGEGLEQ
jgi:hypothetical protein